MTHSVLIVDTCGERASVALFREQQFVTETVLAERTASTGLLAAIRQVLGEGSCALADLDGLGVVSGPGSFTGVRVGLAMAKGLCESVDLPLAAVSRLAVLAEASGTSEAIAVLRAGRDELYVRTPPDARSGAVEQLVSAAELRQIAAGREIVFAEEALSPLLASVEARLVPLSASSAFASVLRVLREGETNLAHVDANYVRDERTIYRRAQGSGVLG